MRRELVNNFNYNFPDTGVFTVSFAGASCGIFSAFNVNGEIFVNSRVKTPNPLQGPNMCSAGQTYTYTSVPPLGLDDETCFYHYEYYWSAPAGWSINGGGNTFFGHGNSVNIAAPINTPPGSYNVSVQSTIPNGQSGPAPSNRFLSLPRNYAIQIGAFNASQVTVSGTLGVCNGRDYTYEAQVPGGHRSGYNYNWVIPSGWGIESISTNKIRVYIPLNNNSYGQVKVSVDNGCGTPSPFSEITTFQGTNCHIKTAGSFKVYPNPTDGELNIEYQLINDPKSLSSEEEDFRNNNFKPEFKIILYDKDQKVVRIDKSLWSKVEIDTYDLQQGTYFLHILFGKEVTITQVIVK